MTDLLCITACVAAGGLIAAFSGPLASAARSLWRRWRHGPPVRWRVHVIDPDGVPMRDDHLSAAGIAQLVSDLNAGRFARS